MGFEQSSNDPCIYISTTDGLLILAVYVDDILLAGKSPQRIAQVKADLGKRFQVKYTGELHYFLGVSVKQNSDTDKIWIGQPSYTQAVLKKFGLEHCKSATTPVAQGTKLLKAKNWLMLLYTNLPLVCCCIFPDGLDQTLPLLYAILLDSALSQPKNIGWQLNAY